MKIEVKQKHIDLAPKLFSKGANQKNVVQSHAQYKRSFQTSLCQLVGLVAHNMKIKCFMKVFLFQ